MPSSSYVQQLHDGTNDSPLSLPQFPHGNEFMPTYAENCAIAGELAVSVEYAIILFVRITLSFGGMSLLLLMVWKKGLYANFNLQARILFVTNNIVLLLYCIALTTCNIVDFLRFFFFKHQDPCDYLIFGVWSFLNRAFPNYLEYLLSFGLFVTVIERVVATIAWKTYEAGKGARLAMFLVVIQFVGATAIMYTLATGYNFFELVVSSTVVSPNSITKFKVIKVIQSLILAASLVILIAIFIVNRRRYWMCQKGLACRYQVRENIRAFYSILPLLGAFIIFLLPTSITQFINGNIQTAEVIIWIEKGNLAPLMFISVPVIQYLYKRNNHFWRSPIKPNVPDVEIIALRERQMFAGPKEERRLKQKDCRSLPNLRY